ncbi:MAG: glycosyl hydrolase [Balneolaceae bacterium]|nr:glycosyl hydrolase [Balneolaceae bacterium]
MKSLYRLFIIVLLIGSTPLLAQENITDINYGGLKLRNIGPALFSGRIADIAIDQNDSNRWFVAVGSGGVWRTENGGVTWKPIFDHQSSYSIGSVTIDPNDSHTIWVGTGENVGGRHVGYGDGVYKSTDGGRSWKNMGLKNSEHISKVVVHPENSDIIWVAAQGPLWSKGGERGLYKSTDGGESWEKTLGNDEWTGVTDIELDPENSDVLYAATWDRHRTVAAYMGGGPGSGIHKSTDGGESWTELKNGLPGSNLGKIGMDISPQNPNVIYAAIELDRSKGGLYMSENKGASWRKMSNTVSGGTGPHYYQELYASPHEYGTIYLVSNYTVYSKDHGANFSGLSVNNKHVDDHAIAFKKDDPDYLLVGSDGGLYETRDHAKSWNMIRNLPITQFYKVAVDNAQPFYNVYGGTQDNGSQSGPSRTENSIGITNRDWWKTLGADGHDTATEPGNPNIFYAETQQGGLHRVDRRTQDAVFIQPQAGEGEGFERFNWDAPIEVSPHSPTKLLFASQRVWISEDRGDNWEAISGDLSRNQERITLPIMGKQKSWDNPWDMGAMSNYNTITSLAESPKQEGLIYAGTDDGLIHVTEDGGENWRRIDVGDIDEVPSHAFVNDIKADLFDVNTVYAALDNHKNGDYNPYLLKSTNRGKSWKLISGDLPDRHLVWRVIQDDEKKELMFAATEFGIFFTVDGGEEWIKLKGGVPTISFRDLELQREKDDLVGASFGRGFYILDNYAPLRNVNEELLEKEATFFQPKDAYWYQPDQEVDDLGSNFFTAENPPFGAVFTYYLKDGYKSLTQQRKETERALEEDEDVIFPGWDSLEAEKREEGPQVFITIKDSGGNVVKRVQGATAAGFHRINWELDYASKDVVEVNEQPGGWFGGGFKVTPGTYTATLYKKIRGEVSPLSNPVTFEVKPLRDGTLERASNSEIAAFRETLTSFQQDLSLLSDELDEQINHIKAMQVALSRASKENIDLEKKLHEARLKLLEIQEELQGSDVKGEVGERSAPTPSSRMFVGMRALFSTYGPTPTHKKAIEVGIGEMEAIQLKVQAFVDSELPVLERALEAAGAPPIKD